MSLDVDEITTVELLDETGRAIEIRKTHIQPARLWSITLEQDSSTTQIPTRLSYTTLDRVVQFLNYHATVPFCIMEKPLRSCNLLEHGVSEWDLQLIDLSDPELFALMHAANYLDCAPLLDLCSAKLATYLKNQSVAYIRDRFHIQNDLSPEEELAIEQEVHWAYDL